VGSNAPSRIPAAIAIAPVDAYSKLDEREHWSALEQMSIDESIAVGEAPLTSELMDLQSAKLERPRTWMSPWRALDRIGLAI